jgi:hypothetical protein
MLGVSWKNGNSPPRKFLAEFSRFCLVLLLAALLQLAFLYSQTQATLLTGSAGVDDPQQDALRWIIADGNS